MPETRCRIFGASGSGTGRSYRAYLIAYGQAIRSIGSIFDYHHQLPQASRPNIQVARLKKPNPRLKRYTPSLELYTLPPNLYTQSVQMHIRCHDKCTPCSNKQAPHLNL